MGKLTTPPDPAQHHDMGGRHGEIFESPIDLHEHPPAYWERRIDAMLRLLMGRGVLGDVAVLRRGIEALTPGDYERLTYYERWARSIGLALVEQGVLTSDEIEAKITELQARANPSAVTGERP